LRGKADVEVSFEVSFERISQIHELLRGAQNPDGGWGYRKGKESWLEPTVYALQVLHTDPASTACCERAWQLLNKWSLLDGGWQLNSRLRQANWTSALVVRLLTRSAEKRDSAVPQAPGTALERLIRIRGAEDSNLVWFFSQLGLNSIRSDVRLVGWPWLEGNSSWVEPTAHHMIALRRTLMAFNLSDSQKQAIQTRLELAKEMLLDRRLADGGWNHGSLHLEGEALSSYPETTGLAMLALAGLASANGANSKPNSEKLITKDQAQNLLRHHVTQTRSIFALSWLSLAMRAWGINPQPALEKLQQNPSADLMTLALQALVLDGGNHRELLPVSKFDPAPASSIIDSQPTQQLSRTKLMKVKA
jgi:hypothetical protein